MLETRCYCDCSRRRTFLSADTFKVAQLAIMSPDFVTVVTMPTCVRRSVCPTYIVYRPAAAAAPRRHLQVGRAVDSCRTVVVQTPIDWHWLAASPLAAAPPRGVNTARSDGPWLAFPLDSVNRALRQGRVSTKSAWVRFFPLKALLPVENWKGVMRWQCDDDDRSWCKRCNNIVSYEVLWIRRTCDYYVVECKLNYCMLFSSRVRVRFTVRIWFSVWLCTGIFTTFGCHCYTAVSSRF